MQNILITGANGFIGSKLLNHISSVIDKKSKIILLSSTASQEYEYVLHKDYQFTADDFSDKGFDCIDIVIHAGAFTPKSSAEANLYNENFENVIRTNYLLNNLPNIPGKVIFLSTLDVYIKTTAIIDENTLLSPSGFYGSCKLFCEKMIEQWGKNVNCKVEILRLGHIYGSGEEAYKKLIPQAIRSILQGKNPIIFSEGTEKRSYLHIDDCVRAIWNATLLKEDAGPINIVSGKAYAIKDIIQKLIDISEKDLNIEVLNKPIIVWDILFNAEKMKRYLTNEQIDIAEGLKEEFYNFNENKN